MADSLFASLLGALGSGGIGELAGALGQSEQSILRGLESSVAAVLGGLAGRSQDLDALVQIFDLASYVPGSATWSNMAREISDPDSPLILGGKRVLSVLFGNAESAVASLVSAESGLQADVTLTVMGIAALVVANVLDRQLRNEELSISGLGGLLQHERAAIPCALPAGLSDLLRSRPSMAGTACPAVDQAVKRERSSVTWLPAFAIVASVLGVFWVSHYARLPTLFWVFPQGRRPTTSQVGSALAGSADRVATEEFSSGDVAKHRLPNGVELNIPEKGVETQLLRFIQNPGATPNGTTWFDCDRLRFDTGSATLRPESQEQISKIAAILLAYPNVHMKVAGYSENVGSTDADFQLSRERAGSVVAELVRRGVSPDRLAVGALGKQHAADNSAEAGRMNGGVAIRIVQK
jgi:outer membrane protein OmpA-like peptidoglycan-associated protein